MWHKLKLSFNIFIQISAEASQAPQQEGPHYGGPAQRRVHRRQGRAG